MKRVFLDTSYVFKLIKFITHKQNKQLSYFPILAQHNSLITSDYVLEELVQPHILAKLKLTKEELLKAFIKLASSFNIKILKTQKLQPKFLEYVNDKNDAYILQDAVYSDSQFILTYNQKDFDLPKIKQDFNIVVTHYILV